MSQEGSRSYPGYYESRNGTGSEETVTALFLRNSIQSSSLFEFINYVHFSEKCINYYTRCWRKINTVFVVSAPRLAVDCSTLIPISDHILIQLYSTSILSSFYVIY